MTHAELLRSHANLAIKEGGMYYSGEYLSGIATAAESLEAENTKLRELVRIMAYCMQHERECDGCRINGADGTITEPVGCVSMFDRMCDIGVEVNR